MPERSLRRLLTRNGEFHRGSSVVVTFSQGDVSSRSFEDSTGVSWDVFEVRRASEDPRGVSPGLEKGWLAFVSAAGKRRLAPFPSSWETDPESELERLCAAARVANPARYSREALLGADEIGSAPAAAMGQRAVASEPMTVAELDHEQGNLVRRTVREFAQQARVSNLPAIEAMVRLKTLLHERFGGQDVEPRTKLDATDMRRVRRWFVEAFYFER